MDKKRFDRLVLAGACLALLAGCQSGPGSSDNGSRPRARSSSPTQAYNEVREEVVGRCSQMYMDETRDVAALFINHEASARKMCECVASMGDDQIRAESARDDGGQDPFLTTRILQEHAADCILLVGESDIVPGQFDKFKSWGTR